jgi:hypothetical protein
MVLDGGLTVHWFGGAIRDHITGHNIGELSFIASTHAVGLLAIPTLRRTLVTLAGLVQRPTALVGISANLDLSLNARIASLRSPGNPNHLS